MQSIYIFTLCMFFVHTWSNEWRSRCWPKDVIYIGVEMDFFVPRVKFELFPLFIVNVKWFIHSHLGQSKRSKWTTSVLFLFIALCFFPYAKKVSTFTNKIFISSTKKAVVESEFARTGIYRQIRCILELVKNWAQHKTHHWEHYLKLYFQFSVFTNNRYISNFLKA